VSQKKAKNVLTDFGLTSKEADTYIFLARHEVLTGGEIAKQTKIARSLVYRILKSLQAKGLVEPTLESPKRFVAIPFEKALDLIIKTRQEEALLVEKAKKELLEDWKVISKAKLEAKYEKFVVIEGSKKIYAKILHMIKETKNQFSGILPVSALARAEQFGVFDAAYNHPLKSRVKFQFLTDLAGSDLEAIKLLKPKLRAELCLKTRNSGSEVTTSPRVVMRDGEEILFFIKPETETATRKQGEVCIYTNCQSLVQTFTGVFQDLWRSSTDIEDRIGEIETGKLPTAALTMGEKAGEKILKTLETQKGDVTPRARGRQEELPTVSVSEIPLLEEAERDILDCASVVGEEFSPDIIERLTGSSRLKVLKTLINLERKHQLIRSADGRYRFSHPKIREAVYNEIRPELRRICHSLTAKYLEEANKERLEESVEELAYHYYRSVDAQKAVPYLLRAGENAWKEFLSARSPTIFDAEECFSQALKVMGNKEIWIEERLSTLEKLGDINSCSAHHDEANSFYEKGLAIADEQVVRDRLRKKIRNRRLVEKGGLKLAYYVYGEGNQTILFVGHSSHLMLQIHYFSQKYKVVVMDLSETLIPGKKPAEYTMALYVDHLKTIIEDLQEDHIYLASLVLGGTLAIEYVAKYPERIAKLALTVTPIKGQFSDSDDRKKRYDEFWAMAFQSPSWGWDKLQQQRAMAMTKSYADSDRIRDLEFFKVQKIPPEVYLIYQKLSWEADVRPLLDKIRIPTLILHGEISNVPLESARYLNEKIPGSKLHVFKGANMVTFKEAKKFNRLLEEFFTFGTISENCQ
jgi:sugar-specific transcriptional regulator TrmB/pimeloyl-ACP methyl ester carboxylesterase